MLSYWVKLAGVVLFFVCLAGCRKSMPQIKPPTTAEVLAVPPLDTRYANNSYPKEAFADRESGIMRAGMTGSMAPVMAGSGIGSQGTGSGTRMGTPGSFGGPTLR